MNKRGIYIRSFIFVAAVFCSGELYGQMHKERRHIRAGNRDYEALNYSAAEGDYRSAGVENPLSYEAQLNLGDALYKQERYEEATGVFKQLNENPLLDDVQRAKTLYNLGNTQFRQQQYKESAESYAASLMLNPSDMEAKYNLAYVQKLLEDEPEGGGGDNKDNEDNKDNKDGGNDQNNNDRGDNEKEQNDPEDNDKKSDKDDKGGNDDKPQPQDSNPREASISKADAEKMLDAIQQQEDKTREKVNAEKKTAVARSGKNW